MMTPEPLFSSYWIYRAQWLSCEEKLSVHIRFSSQFKENRHTRTRHTFKLCPDFQNIIISYLAVLCQCFLRRGFNLLPLHPGRPTNSSQTSRIVSHCWLMTQYVAWHLRYNASSAYNDARPSLISRLCRYVNTRTSPRAPAIFRIIF